LRLRKSYPNGAKNPKIRSEIHHRVFWWGIVKKKRKKVPNRISAEMSAAVMTLRQLADYLHCDRATLYTLIRNGDIPTFQVGSGYRFRRLDIDEWVDKLEVSPAWTVVSREPLRRQAAASGAK
jgi:excisionase family DNA binding protein